MVGKSIRNDKAKNLTDADAQMDRFREAARRLGCDQDEVAFKERLSAVVRRNSKSPLGTGGKPRKVGGGQFESSRIKS